MQQKLCKMILDDGMPELPKAILTKPEVFLEKAKKYTTKMYRVFCSSAKNSDMFKSLTHFNHYRIAKGDEVVEEYSLLPKEYQSQLDKYYRPFESLKGNEAWIADEKLEALQRKLTLTPATLTMFDAMEFNPDLAPFFQGLAMKEVSHQRKVFLEYAGDDLRFSLLRAMLKVNGGHI